jgi:hypothetical protein
MIPVFTEDFCRWQEVPGIERLARSALTGLSSTPADLAASVSFTSHRNPADSATGTSCTTWDITLYLQTSGTSYLIGSPPPGYQARDQPCS